VQEEEYQLELYRSTVGVGGAPEKAESPPPEPQLSLRIAFDDKGTASATQMKPVTRRPLTSPRDAAAQARVRRGRRDAQAAQDREKRRREVRGQVKAKRATSNEQALEYVARMRTTHSLPPRTVATFVELLRAYKRKTFPARDVAERVAELLRGYPDLIRDFEHFLPPRDAVRDLLRSAAARDRGPAEGPDSEFTRTWRDRAAGRAPDLALLAGLDTVDEAAPADAAGDAAAAAVAADARAAAGNVCPALDLPKRHRSDAVHATWSAARVVLPSRGRRRRPLHSVADAPIVGATMTHRPPSQARGLGRL
jgi:hypothetical protein